MATDIGAGLQGPEFARWADTAYATVERLGNGQVILFANDPFFRGYYEGSARLLLNAVILPLRPRHSARAYRKIWLPQGAPLLVHGQALREAVAAALGSPYVVELAMRYGTPSILSALQRLCALDVARTPASAKVMINF